MSQDATVEKNLSTADLSLQAAGVAREEQQDLGVPETPVA